MHMRKLAHLYHPIVCISSFFCISFVFRCTHVRMSCVGY